MLYNKSQFKVGDVFYKVHALGSSSYVTRYEVTSLPHVEGTCRGLFIDTDISKYISFEDMNIQDDRNYRNAYNCHFAFRSLAAARRYCDTCISNNIRWRDIEYSPKPR